ncbi:MAG TPA: hypothetical protein H9996_09160 [Candidatus Faecalibacterium avium]|nr:hypothetical protein [Candidatus Faecalibacterium avium]
MKQLIAKRSILYQNRIYGPGAALPAADGRMAEAWLRAGSAAWQEDTPPAEGEKMLTGHLDPAQLAEMTKAELTDLAGELGLDVSAAKTKADLVALIGAAEVQAPAEAVQDTDDETQQNDDEGTQ